MKKTSASDTVQLFFNGNKDKDYEINKQDDLYKNYIIKQNQNFLKDNKKLLIEISDLKKKIEEEEEINDTTSSRIKRSKEYLKSYRDLNISLEKMNKNYYKFIKNLNFTKLIYFSHICIGVLFLSILMCNIFNFSQWWIFLLLTGFSTLYMNFFIPYFTNIKEKINYCLKIKINEDLEMSKLKRSMDIITEVIDNL